MKVKLLIAAIIIASLYIAQPASAQSQSQCVHNLKWQRKSYEKAHYNITESIQQRAPSNVNWNVPTARNCDTLESTARTLQLAENSRWSKLRLQRAGVKWIIRRQFQSAGHNIVLRAWKVASCESNFNPLSKSSTGDTGVWQINWIHHEPDSLMESPEQSTAWAWRASDHGRNFSPTWVCATHYGIA